MKCFIGVIASIAMFNLNEDEFESHFLKDGRRAFIIDATDEKISGWKEANENNLIDCSLEEIRTNSETLDFTKKRILEFINKKAGEYIFAVYPNYKQNNINELQGYSEEDKNSMWIFINSIRQETNNLEEQIKNALTLKQLKIIESEM